MRGPSSYSAAVPVARRQPQRTQRRATLRAAALVGALGVLTAAGLTAALPAPSPARPVSRLEAPLHDLVFGLAGPARAGARALLVDIDEATLEAFRRPLVAYGPLLARCSQNLAAHGVHRIAIDLSWQLNPGSREKPLECLGPFAEGVDGELTRLICAQVAEAAGTFLDPSKDAPSYSFATLLNPESPTGYALPPARWCGRAPCEGLADLDVDPVDGVIRTYQYREPPRMSLGAFVAGDAAGTLTREWLRPSLPPSEPLSFKDCVDGRFPGTASLPEAAMIAGCAPSLKDRQALVGAGDMCAAAIHLAAASLATGDHPPRPAGGATRFLTSAGAAVLIAAGVALAGGPGIVGGLLLALSALALALPLALSAGSYVPALPPLVTAIGTAILATATRLTGEARSRQRLSRAISAYLPRQAVERVLTRFDGRLLDGENVDVAVLFSDVTNYTSIAELLTPPGVIALLNWHLRQLTDIAVAHGAWIEGYVGDQVVAYWPAIAGTDIPDVADANRRAFAAARDILSLLPSVGERLRSVLGPEVMRGDPDQTVDTIARLFGYGIGVHGGSVVLGDMGSQHLRKFGITGDTMNIASRVEGLTRKLRTPLVLTQAVAVSVVPESVRALVPVRVKGRAEPVLVYEDASVSRPARFEEALRLWQDEPGRFGSLLAAAPDLARDPFVALLATRMEGRGVLSFDES